MNKNNYIKPSLYSLIIWLLSSCAQPLAPTGGPKDTTPPKTVKYIPDSAALHFKAKQIRILFNEFIQLKNVSSQLVISPPLKHAPDVKVRGKELFISLTDTLAENTTYDFNFADAVADLNEGNVLKNFQYIFSTGSFIDSMSLKGTVRDALTLTPQKDVLVMLYNTFDDSLPFKKIPNYFGKTGDNGSYKINNIRAGRYKVFALKDANANYLYDTPEESIGFSDSLVDLDSNKTVDLLMFMEGPKKQYIKKSKVLEHGHIQFVFNKPVSDLILKPLNFNPKSKDWEMEEFNSFGDTLDLWLPNFKKDSLKLLASDGKKISDTLEFAIPPKVSKDKKFKLSYKTNAEGLLDLNRDLWVQFNHYLDPSSLVTDSIKIKEDSVLYTKKDLDISVYRKRIKISKKDPGVWKEGAKYNILILPGAISDIFGLKNDSIRLSFKTRELKYYGTLKMKVNLSPALYGSLFQLLNDKDQVVRQKTIADSNPFTLEFLYPQDYKMRIVIDENKNGTFDGGNYLKRDQPEKVIYFPGKITIRSNWDMEQEWKISQ